MIPHLKRFLYSGKLFLLFWRHVESFCRFQQLKIRSLSQSYTHTLTLSLTLSYTHSLSPSLSHTNTHSLSLTHTLSLSLSLSNKHSLCLSLLHTHTVTLPLSLSHKHSLSGELLKSRMIITGHFWGKPQKKLVNQSSPSIFICEKNRKVIRLCPVLIYFFFWVLALNIWAFFTYFNSVLMDR